MPSSKKEHKQKSTSSGSVPSTSRTVWRAMQRLSPQRAATQGVSTAEGSSALVASDVTVSRPETEAVATSDANVTEDMYPVRDMSPSKVSRGLLDYLVQGPEFGPPVGTQLSIRPAFVRPTQSLFTPAATPESRDVRPTVSFEDTVRGLSSLYPTLPRVRIFSMAGSMMAGDVSMFSSPPDAVAIAVSYRQGERGEGTD